MKGIWKGYERDMKGIWKGYERDMKEIWKGYERGMKIRKILEAPQLSSQIVSLKQKPILRLMYMTMYQLEATEQDVI